MSTSAVSVCVCACVCVGSEVAEMRCSIQSIPRPFSRATQLLPLLNSFASSGIIPTQLDLQTAAGGTVRATQQPASAATGAARVGKVSLCLYPTEDRNRQSLRPAAQLTRGVMDVITRALAGAAASAERIRSTVTAPTSADAEQDDTGGEPPQHQPSSAMMSAHEDEDNVSVSSSMCISARSVRSEAFSGRQVALRYDTLPVREGGNEPRDKK